jgi:hypothetical protein
MRKLTAIAATLALAAPLAAQANIQKDTTGSGTYFDFYDGSLLNVLDSTTDALKTNVNGIGLTVTAVSSSASAKVARNTFGVGLKASLLEAGELNSGLLGAGGDALLLSFSEAVTLNAVGLSLWENGLILPLDKASITSNGIKYNLSNAMNNGGIPITTFSLGSGQIPASRTFLLSAEGDLSAFRLAGLKVSSVSAVPEAPTHAMLLLGLGGLAALKLRRSRQN